MSSFGCCLFTCIFISFLYAVLKCRCACLKKCLLAEVRSWTGQLAFNLGPGATVGNLKDKLKVQECVWPSALVLNGKALKDDMQLSDCDINNEESILDCEPKDIRDARGCVGGPRGGERAGAGGEGVWLGGHGRLKPSKAPITFPSS